MSKKIFLVFAAILMVFAFAGSKAVAGNATAVYLELSKQTTSPYDPSPIRGRATFIDAAGVLATTFDDQPIADASLVISSSTFGSDVLVSPDSYTTPAAGLAFSAAPRTIDLDSAWHEFALNYNGVPEIGNDTLRATLKLGTKTLIAELPIVVTGPMANCYVVRSGGIESTSLPAVLDPIPNPGADGGFPRRAGANVPIDVFAAYGVDTDGDYDVDKFIFTNRLPAGAENVSISGGASASVVLVDGHVATTIQVTSLGLATALKALSTDAAQLVEMQRAFANGKQFTWAAASKIISEIGYSCGQVNADDQLELCGQTTFGSIANLTLDASVSPTFNTDTSVFFPGDIQKVNMVGLPVTSVLNTGATEGFLASGVSPLDAIYYLPDFTAKPSTFKVNGDGTSDVVYGALIGYDAYKNPAPFNASGAVVGFDMLTTLGSASITAVGPWSDYTAGVLSGGTITETFFLPFQATANVNGMYAESSGVPASAISAIGAGKGVTFAIENRVAAMPTSTPFPTVNAAAGDKGVTIGVTGTSGENSFDLRVVKQSGTLVKVNKEGETTALNSVAIPLKKSADNTAEQKVAFFTTVSDEALHYIFTGDSQKTVFAYKSAAARVEPADSGDFAPSAVTASITKAGAILDTDHDEVTTCAFGVSDAFGNSYKFTASATTITTIEDSDATVAVFLADGVTPFPGASASIDNNNVVVQFRFDEVPAGAGTAIIVVTAGSASAQMTVNIRALQQTKLAAKFIPINGINDTPVMLNFGDQDGYMISPVIDKSCVAGTFDVDIETTDGSLTGIGDTQALTTFAPSAIFTAKTDTGKTIMTIDADGGDAKATNTTLTLDFNADFEPPVIGAVTAGSCSIDIAATDNKALNLAGSTVVVKKSGGEDITSTLTRTNVGDGTATGSIQFTGLPGVDIYSLEIVLKDKANNEASSTRTANVTTCAQAACGSVNPAFGQTGTTLDVTITGSNTNFGATSVVTFSCTGITVNSTTATSGTSITANITIAADAAEGKCDVTVTTGAEAVTCLQAFELTNVPVVVSCLSVVPSSVDAGTSNKDVVITLENIDLTGATGISVSFGCTGVTVNSATVNSATQITANISVSATAQQCTGNVTITGAGSAGIVCQNAFTVKAAVVTPCTLTVSPSPFSNGIILPRIRTFTFSGANSSWNTSSTVKIAGINLVIVTSRSASQIKALVLVPSKLRLPAGNKAVTITTGTEVCTGTLVIQ